MHMIKLTKRPVDIVWVSPHTAMLSRSISDDCMNPQIGDFVEICVGKLCAACGLQANDTVIY